MFEKKKKFVRRTTHKRNIFFLQAILCNVIFNFLHFNTLSQNFKYTAIGNFH